MTTGSASSPIYYGRWGFFFSGILVVMAMEENLGPQFAEHIKLYRGLDQSIGSTDFGNLGIHWTPNKDIAEQFATMGDRDEGEEGGVVLHAEVSPEHIIQRGTPEHEEYSDKYDIYEEDDPEEETTIRKGAPVKVHGYTDVSPEEDGRVSREHVAFPNPRQGKA